MSRPCEIKNCRTRYNKTSQINGKGLVLCGNHRSQMFWCGDTYDYLSEKKIHKCSFCGGKTRGYKRNGKIYCRWHIRMLIKDGALKKPYKICSSCGEKRRGYEETICLYHNTKKLLCRKCSELMNEYGYIPKQHMRRPNVINEYNDKGIAEIILYDARGNKKSKTIIDLEDIRKVKGLKWFANSKSYPMTTIKKNNKRVHYTLHSIILGNKKDCIIDHIDRNPLNNKKSNLRFADVSLNRLNCKAHKNNKLGVKNIGIHGGKYRVVVTYKGKRKQILRDINLDKCIKFRNNYFKENFGVVL